MNMITNKQEFLESTVHDGARIKNKLMGVIVYF
jgi:hypothetical protein